MALGVEVGIQEPIVKRLLLWGMDAALTRRGRVFIAGEDTGDFVDGGDAGGEFADAAFDQEREIRLAGDSLDLAVIGLSGDGFADVVVDDEDFEDAGASFEARARAIGTGDFVALFIEDGTRVGFEGLEVPADGEVEAFEGLFVRLIGYFAGGAEDADESFGDDGAERIDGVGFIGVKRHPKVEGGEGIGCGHADIDAMSIGAFVGGEFCDGVGRLSIGELCGEDDIGVFEEDGAEGLGVGEFGIAGVESVEGDALKFGLRVEFECLDGVGKGDVLAEEGIHGRGAAMTARCGDDDGASGIGGEGFEFGELIGVEANAIETEIPLAFFIGGEAEFFARGAAGGADGPCGADAFGIAGFEFTGLWAAAFIDGEAAHDLVGLDGSFGFVAGIEGEVGGEAIDAHDESIA